MSSKDIRVKLWNNQIASFTLSYVRWVVEVLISDIYKSIASKRFIKLCHLTEFTFCINRGRWGEGELFFFNMVIQ